ncbi:MAG: sensor histidine kinase [Chitinophagales bacterium]
MKDIDYQKVISELGHTIRISISSIMNRAQFLKMEFPNPDFEGVFKLYAHEIYQEMIDLRRVVDFMLSYANTDSSFEDFDIKTLIERLFRYTYQTQLAEENIHVALDLQATIELHYQKKFFEDIIGNLISNSIKILKATENKTIKCSTQIMNDKFVILFSDNGPGVEESIKDKIFDIYISTTQEQGGAGVGLYIVKTRLTALNGTIELVESEFTSHGATFKITLPFKK